MVKLSARVSLESDFESDFEKRLSVWKRKTKEVEKSVSKSWEAGRKYPQPQPKPTEQSFEVELLRKEFLKRETPISEWTHAHRLCVIIGHNFHVSLKSDGTNKTEPPNCWNTDRVFLEDRR